MQFLKFLPHKLILEEKAHIYPKNSCKQGLKRYDEGMKAEVKSEGFTLIELLVVISIIAMLLAILMPSLTRSREEAKRVTCMANLHAIGQSLFLYAHDYRGMIVPGECQIPWEVWAQPTEYIGEGVSTLAQPVNLGHLLSTKKLQMPTSDNHVLFCPSGNNVNMGKSYKDFKSTWGKNESKTSITYMFNNGLDGFGDCVLSGEQAVLFHINKVNYLMSDSSVHPFTVKKVVYANAIGPEDIVHVCARTGVCFPTIMMFEWFEKGNIDVDQAKEFLKNPASWVSQNSASSFSKTVMLSNLRNKALVADVVGGWRDQVRRNTEPPINPPG